jgi:hypothetical protein
MYRLVLTLGAVFDLLIAGLLVIVSGWIVDSWHDPREPWAGPIVTAFWLVSLVLSAGAPVLAYRLRRRHAPAGRVLLAMWLPAALLTLMCLIGFALFTP